MLHVKLDEARGIVILEPEGKLTEADFKSAAKLIDPYLKQAGKLLGLMIYVQSFPGWSSFAALTTHLKFIQEHHKK